MKSRPSGGSFFAGAEWLILNVSQMSFLFLFDLHEGQ